MKKEMRRESLIVRDEVIEFLKEISGYDDFLVNYNDLYKIKDNYEVRRLKGYFCKDEILLGDSRRGFFKSYNYRSYYSSGIKEDVWKEWKNELESLDFGNFKVELNSLRLDRKDSYFKMSRNEGDKVFIIKIVYKEL
jgi:hypothetical protein